VLPGSKVEFVVLMAVSINITAFWDAPPCSLVDGYQNVWRHITEDRIHATGKGIPEYM
jgi:hypothetical protein